MARVSRNASIPYLLYSLPTPEYAAVCSWPRIFIVRGLGKIAKPQMTQGYMA